MRQRQPTWWGAESVGDNMAAASLDSNEEVTSPYGAGGPPPAPADAPAQGYNTNPFPAADFNALPDAFAGDAPLFPGTSDGYAEVYGLDAAGYSLESDGAGGDLTSTAPYNGYGGAWGPEPPVGTADALLPGPNAESGVEPLTVGGAEDGFLEEGTEFEEESDPFAVGEGRLRQGPGPHGGPGETNPFALSGDGAQWESGPFAVGDPAGGEVGSILEQPKDSGAFGSTFFPGGSAADESGLGSTTGSGLQGLEAFHGSGYEKALPGSGLGGVSEEFGSGDQGEHPDAGQAVDAVFDSAVGYDANVDTTQYSLVYQDESYQAEYTLAEAGAEGATEGVLYGGYTWDQVIGPAPQTFLPPSPCAVVAEQDI